MHLVTSLNSVTGKFWFPCGNMMSFFLGKKRVMLYRNLLKNETYPAGTRSLSKDM